MKSDDLLNWRVGVLVFIFIIVFSFWLADRFKARYEAFHIKQVEIAQKCEQHGGFVIWEYFNGQPYRVERCER